MKASNPRNILKYQTNDISDMSLKQILPLISGVAVYFILGFILKLLFLPPAAAFIIALFPSAPIILSAFLKVSGLSFLEVIKRVFDNLFLNRDVRPYKSKGFYSNEEK